MKTNYLSATEAAKYLDLSRARIKLLASQKRIRGAIKIGQQWAIPFPPKILPLQK